MKTESDVWTIVKPKFERWGSAARIENSAGSSVSDIILAAKGLLTYVELKIDRDGWVWMPRYQYAYGVRIKKFIEPERHWVAVWRDEGLYMYHFADIIKAPTKDAEDKVGFQYAALMSEIHLKTNFSYEIWAETML